MPKDRPILFNADMVRALLDGRKTQTRRVMKPQPEPTPDDYPGPKGHWWPCNTVQSMVHIEDEVQNGKEWSGFAAAICPYGQAGDRLWVREAWGVVSHAFDENGDRQQWEPDRPATPVYEMPFGKGYYHGHVIYAADGGFEWAGDDDGGGEPRSAWKPSIHMPRIASRILLEIVSVSVERLQGISEADAMAEGIELPENGTYRDYSVKPEDNEGYDYCKSAVESYRTLWEKINGSDSWTANPWVWVVEFKRAEDSQ